MTTFLSPIQESNSEQSTSTRTSSPRSNLKRSHHVRTTVSAFSSLNDLKAQQRQLYQHRSARIKVGGNVSTDYIMTAIPQSHFGYKSGAPNAADMKLLGFELSDLDENSYDVEGAEMERNDRRSHPAGIKDKELRDESSMTGVSFEDEKSSSFDLDGDEFSIEDDDNSAGIPRAVTTQSFDDVSAIGSRTKGMSERTLSRTNVIEERELTEKKSVRVLPFHKPMGKIAVKLWRSMKPLICKPKMLCKKKKIPLLERSKGVLT